MLKRNISCNLSSLNFSFIFVILYFSFSSSFFTLLVFLKVLYITVTIILLIILSSSLLQLFLFRLRELINKYDASRLPPSGGAISSSPIASEDTYLMNHLKASLESVWVFSNQNWEILLRTLESEIGEQVKDFIFSYFFLFFYIYYAFTIRRSVRISPLSHYV